MIYKFQLDLMAKYLANAGYRIITVKAYISKPFSYDSLVRAVQGVIG